MNTVLKLTLVCVSLIASRADFHAFRVYQN